MSAIHGLAALQCAGRERYDRARSGRALIRVHQEDLCQALGVAPTTKYQAEGGPGPPEVAALLRRAMPARVAEAAVWQFTDALVWNWLIAGTDAHAKNYSVLLSAGQVRLAPLYDVASALPYGTDERKLRLAMKLGDDYRLNDRRPTLWAKVAAQLGVRRQPPRLTPRLGSRRPRTQIRGLTCTFDGGGRGI